MLDEKSTSVFTANVKWMVSIALFVVGVVGPYYDIKTQIALMQASVSNINSNHEVHIQDITQEIKDMKAVEVDQQKQIIELQKQILVLISKK